MEEILSLVFKDTNVNFDNYKKATLKRRIQKRVDTLNLDNFEAYYKYLKKHKEEVKELYNTMLIGVTEFFRDTEAYTSLKKHLSNLLSTKKAGDSIRIWSVGCSNGAEVYTISMLLHELLGENIEDYSIKIFGSDIHESSIAFARKGIYSTHQLSNCPKKFIKKYFHEVENGYQVNESLKKPIVFSLHDITIDPPFLKLDLITCRNLMIYFEKEQQNEIIYNFHYCLNNDALLFLGKSENISDFQEFFDVIDTRYKIFQAKKQFEFPGYNFNKLINSHQKSVEVSKPVSKNVPSKSLKEAAQELIIKTYENPYVVINDNLEIIESEGSLRLYLEIETSNTKNNLIKALDKELRYEIHNAILIAKKKNLPIETTVLKFKAFDQLNYVSCKIKPLQKSDSNNKYLLIIFEKATPIFSEKTDLSDLEDLGSDDEVIKILKEELEVSREHLETYRLEIEKRTAEAQSLNEELQSANEELKSANEELETSNEELQALNEELFNSNSSLTESNKKLLEKEHELLLLNSELQQSKNHLEIAKDIGNYISWELDRKKGTTKGTKELLDLFGVYDKDQTYMTSNQWMELVNPDDALMIAEKFKDFSGKESPAVKVEYRITRKDNNEERWIESISTVKDNKVISVVRDITEVKNHQVAIIEEKEKYRTLFNNSQFAIFIIGDDYKIKLLNEKAASYLKHDLAHYVGKDVTNLDKYNPGVFSKQIKEAIKSKSGTTYEAELQTSQGSRWFLYDIYPILDSDGKCKSVQVLSFDTTERKNAVKQLADNEKNLSVIFDNIKDSIILMDIDDNDYLISKVNQKFLETAQSYNNGELTKNPTSLTFEETTSSIIKLPEELLKDTKEILDEVKNTGKTITKLNEVQYPDGIHHMESTYFPITGTSGQCEKILVTSRDISDRINYEKSLKRNESKLQKLLENAYETILLVSKERKFTYLSTNHKNILGDISATEGDDSFSGIHEDDIAIAQAQFDKAIKNPGKNFNSTIRVKDESGGFRWVECNTRNLFHVDEIQSIVINARDVTDKIKAEIELKENEERFRGLLENSNESLILMNEKFEIQYVSQGHEKIFGRPKDSIQLNAPTLNVHPDDQKDVAEFFGKLIKNPGKTFQILLRIRHNDGHYLWIDGYGKNLLHKKEIGGIVINARDISNYIEVQEHLKESENRLKALDEASSEGIFFHANQKLIDCNSAFLKMMGYSSLEEVSKLNLEETAGPYAELILEKIMSGYEGSYEAGLKRKNGELFPVEITSRNTSFNGEKGRITLINDLTERKKIEEKLEEQSAFLSSVLNTLPSYIFLKDIDGKYQMANKALSNLLQKTPEEIIGSKDKDLIDHKELAKKYFEDDKYVMETQNARSYVEEFYLDPQNKRFLHTTKTPLFKDNGDIRGILGISTDITDRINAENALLESETKFRAITEHSPYTTILIDDALIINYCSKEATNLLRLNVEKIINTPLRKFVKKESQKYLANLFAEVEKQADDSLKFDNLMINNGSENKMITDGFIVKLPAESGIGGYLIKLRDITFEKLEEEKRKLLNETVLQLSNNRAIHSGDFESALRVLTKTTSKALKTSRVSIWVYQKKAIHLALMYSNETKKFYRDGSINEKDHPAYFKAVKDKRVVSMVDTSDCPVCESMYESYLKPNNIQSMMDAKFIYDGKFKGVICIEHQNEKREWSIEEQNFVASLADLTTVIWQNHERTLVQAALSKSELEWKNLVNNAPDFIIKINRKKNITFINNSFLKNVDNVIGHNLISLVPQEFKKIVTNVVESAFKESKVGGYEVCINTPNYGMKWFSSRVAPIIINNKVNEALIYSTDITERKRIEMALKEGDIRYKSMIENSTEAIWRLEINPQVLVNTSSKEQANKIFKNAIIAESNTLTAKLLGKQHLLEVINKPLHTLLSGETELLGAIEQFCENKFKASEIEFSIELEKGQRKYIAMYASGFISDGKLTRIWGTFKDITERKEAEFANQRLLKIVEASTDFIGMASPDGKVLFVNSAGKKLMGIPEEKDISAMFLSDFHNDEMTQYMLDVAFPSASKNGTWEGPTTMTNYQGKDVPLSQLVMSHKDQKGNIIFYSTVARDMTANKLNNEKMMQSVVKGVDDERQRIASELHDSLGQLLSAASMNLESIKKESNNLSPVYQKKYLTSLSLINNAIIETREISHDLMPQSLEDFGLILSLEGMLEKVEQAAPFSINFTHFRIPEKLPKNLNINLYRITQEALNNIIKHANASEVVIQMIKHRGSIIFSIEDNGKGFDVNKLQQDGHGVTNIKNRVTSLGGNINILSSKDSGTTISIEIPLDEN